MAVLVSCSCMRLAARLAVGSGEPALGVAVHRLINLNILGTRAMRCLSQGAAWGRVTYDAKNV